jgi:hypothetical protein
MIVVVQHSGMCNKSRSHRGARDVNLDTGCASSPGDVQANIRADIAALKASPYVRNDIPIIGYVLDVGTAQLREVRYVKPRSKVPRSSQPANSHTAYRGMDRMRRLVVEC